MQTLEYAKEPVGIVHVKTNAVIFNETDIIASVISGALLYHILQVLPVPIQVLFRLSAPGDIDYCRSGTQARRRSLLPIRTPSAPKAGLLPLSASALRTPDAAAFRKVVCSDDNRCPDLP